jgi:hypothetical protein
VTLCTALRRARRGGAHRGRHARAGYSGKVAEEIDMLRRLARKGEDRTRLGRLMEVVEDKTASAVAVAPKDAKARAPYIKPACPSPQCPPRMLLLACSRVRARCK